MGTRVDSDVMLFDGDSSKGVATGNVADGTVLKSLEALEAYMHRTDRIQWCTANGLDDQTLAPLAVPSIVPSIAPAVTQASAPSLGRAKVVSARPPVRNRRKN